MTAACVLLFGHDPTVCGVTETYAVDLGKPYPMVGRTEPRNRCNRSLAGDRAINDLASQEERSATYERSYPPRIARPPLSGGSGRGLFHPFQYLMKSSLDRLGDYDRKSSFGLSTGYSLASGDPMAIGATEFFENLCQVKAASADFELAERMMLLWGARVDELTKAGKGPAKR